MHKLFSLTSAKFKRAICLFLVMANIFCSYGVLLAEELNDDTDPAASGTVETTNDNNDAEETSQETSETTDTAVQPSVTPVPTPTAIPGAGDPDEDITPSGKTVLNSFGNGYTVNVSYEPETGIPADAELVVTEIPAGDVYDEYMDKASEALGRENLGYARLFDISLVKDGVEIEPAAGSSVAVKIVLTDAKCDSMDVVHMPDDADAEVVDVSCSSAGLGTEITFDAEGFSTYAVVEAPEPYTPSARYASSLTDLTESNAFLLSIPNQGNKYVTNSLNGNNAFVESSSLASAAEWYFEKVEGYDNRVYIYTMDGTTPKYIKADSNNLAYLVDKDEAAAFVVSMKDGKFRFTTVSSTSDVNNKTLQHSGSGSGVRFHKDQNNNGLFQLTFSSSVNMPKDPYELDGKTYGLMNYSNQLTGEALMSSASGSNALKSKSLLARTNPLERDKLLYVAQDSDITLWTFHSVEKDKYKISTIVNGVPRYLKLTGSGVSLTNASDASLIQVMPGKNEYSDQIRLVSGNVAIALDSGKYVKEAPNANKATQYLYLVDLSDLTDEDFVIYSADKVSVSDTERVKNGEHVIIYTRVWNEEKTRYDFYAVDHDGTLVRCFESGDTIQWVGYKLNTLLWDFVEYYNEGTTDPNYYYELYNEYSGKYIAPQLDGQILSDDTIGINMNGRKKERYYSSIVAWDDSDYAYAAVTTQDGRIVACPFKDAHDFYFAIIQDNTQEQLHEVKTINNDVYGIKMRMIDFDDKVPSGSHNDQDYILGDLTKWENHKMSPQSGILSTHLDDNGYPTTSANRSLYDLYKDSVPVNHLFIDSTYKASGYFEFDSTQNFAKLEDDGDFTVFQELGTMDTDNKPSLKHGQFMPYDKLDIGEYSAKNPLNLYNALQEPLSDEDPRKNEKLYLISDPDYYFGMELETSFVQTPDGVDDWDHDIIYEFTGDDDFWLYVDGELVIDLGGIHSALSGSVNFRTGEVVVNNGTPKTLRAIFEENYRGRNPSASDADVENYLADYFDPGKTTFKNYTSHTMKIFYMERGAGASNLHMRFNQSSVRPGSVLLGKELGGNIDESESVMAEFPYQIYYKISSDSKPVLLSDHDSDVGVVYRGTETPVKYKSSYTIDGVEYRNVFFLAPGEQCEVGFPSDAEWYSLVECGVNDYVYSSVKVNGEEEGVTRKDRENGRSDYSIEYQRVKNRTSVIYENVVNSESLRTLTFKKRVYNETGTELLDDNSPFSFRLYLGAEYEDSVSLADMYVYHIIDDAHNYYKWDVDQQTFVSIGKTDYTSLTEAEKRMVSFTTSMNGAISKIPANLTVEVRELVAGTKFEVEERSYEIPDGYSFKSYDVYLNGKEVAATSPNITDPAIVEIEENNPHVYINNLKGYGFRVNKVWTDKDYMADRAPTYFAIYLKEGNTYTLVDDTVRQMPYDENSIYWYIQRLNGHGFDDFKIREISITAGTPAVDSDGVVTNWQDLTFSPVQQDKKVNLNGRLKGADTGSPYEYTVDYDEGIREDNIRVDTVTNDHHGFTIKKQNWDGSSWLAGAKFTLEDSDGNYIGTFTSDADGLVTIAFFRDGVDYTLTEIKSPQGYLALESPVILRSESGVVSVSGIDSSYYTLTSDTLVLKDKSYSLQAIKTDSEQNPLAGAVFNLHKIKTVNGVTTVDVVPMTGYTELTTGSDGIVPGIDNTLPPGDYQLREKKAPADCSALPSYINFSISNTGVVTLGSHPDEVSLTSTAAEGETRYVMSIVNSVKGVPLIISKSVTGNMGNRMLEFPLTVTFTKDGNAVTGSFAYIKSKGDQLISQGTIETNTSNQLVFTIKDGEIIVINNIPSGADFVVTEDNLGYDTTCYLDDVEYDTDTPSVSGSVPTNSYVRFVNSRNALIPTGLETSFNLSVSILCAMAAGLIVSFVYGRKRRREGMEEDNI